MKEEKVLVEKRYQIIYADPPWEVKKMKRETRPNQVNMDYPTMSLEEIKALPVKNITEDNATLWLWTTQAYLPKAFEVMKEWGFKYQRTITWDKKNGMCFHGFHHRTEFLLFGYKGKCIELYRKGKAFPTIVQERSARHSEKPQIFRDLIMPFGKTRIELFAREKTEGWDVWGNEIPNDVEIGNIIKIKN